MKKQLRRALSALLVLIMVLSILPVSAMALPAKRTVRTTAYYQDLIREMYEGEPGTVGRTHKMQAFIMELALRAKSQNPDFLIIPQDGINVAFVDGDWTKGLNEDLMSLVDGWGIEGMVGTGSSLIPSTNQQKYMKLVEAGKYVSDTTSVTTREQLNNYYARARAWGFVPYPRVGGQLAQSMYPGKRWATNGDYFWVEDPEIIGLVDRVDGSRVVETLADAKSYLYNINGRPYDVWETWDAEEAEYEEGDGDRTRITDSYGCGLLVPSAGGPYKPIGSASVVNNAIATYGEEWDWWWRAAGLDPSAGRETWLNALRNSDYDVIYIDSFYNHRALPENQTPLTREEVESLKVKPDGGTRKIIAYLSIGSAEQNRWYCQDDWTWVDPANPNTYRSMKAGKVARVNGQRVYQPYEPPEGEADAPDWLAFGYGGNYPEESIVEWWNPEWRDIIINGGGKYSHKTTGDNTSSIDRIVAQGFDGVYLDNVSVYSNGNWTYYEAYWQQNGGLPGEVDKGDVVPQNLDYTENPVDVGNPDRGFYRANDGMIVPVEGEGSGEVEVGAEPKQLCGVTIDTKLSHIYFDLRNYSSNAFTGRGTRYTRNYRAPEDVSIKSRGDPEPWDYDTHFDYWKANVVPTWPHGTSQPITEDGLNYIRDKLQQVRDGGGTVIVRFNYDGAGYSWVDANHPQDGYIDQLVADIEPDKEMLLTHIAQLKPILHEYEDVITSVDGGFFGPWGEMHSTTFGTSVQANAWLLNALLDAVPASRSIQVQGGAFLSWYNTYYGTSYKFSNIDQIPAPQPGTPESRFGFFNDSYGFGTDDPEWPPDDWGSLGEGTSWPGNPFGTIEQDWDRGKLMTWIRNQNNFYGGEAQGDETLWNTYPFVGFEGSYAQTVYLNSDYERGVHQRWANFIYNEENVTKPMENAYNDPYKTETAIYDPVYEGKNGLEYWRDRLGYRLVLRDANASEWVAQNGALVFKGKIQNVGFGNIVNRKNVTVILKNKADGSTYSYLTGIDARLWRPDLDSRATNTRAYRDLNFSVKMLNFGEVPVGEYDIFLKINDPKEQSENKRCIRFANNGDLWDAELGANRIGSTVVKESILSSDDEALLKAKELIEAANYVVDVLPEDEAAAIAAIEAIIAGLDIGSVETTVEIVAVDDYSYGFRVYLTRGLSEPLWTTELYLTAAEGIENGQLLPQDLDFSENPVDIPNPDRGFYRASDGMIVPVEGEGSGSVNVGSSPKNLCGVTIDTTLTHMSFDLRAFSSNSLTARGTRYTRNYRAPEDVSIKSRGDPEPWDYDTHFDYWLANDVPNWPHGESGPISEDGLNYIRNKLQAVRDGKGSVVLRFSYDTPGYAWVDCDHPQDGYIDQLVCDIEPDKDTLLMHIQQLKPILHEYEDVITCLDGGFFGPWGEMHSTTFGTSVEANAWLLDALLDAVPESRSIVVQAGAFMSWYNTTYGTNYTFRDIDQIPAPEPGTPESRFGFFNDSYGFGTDDPEWPPDDWGTLGEGAFWPGNPFGTLEEDWDRGRVITWIRNQNNFYGGEAQGGETLWNTYPFVGFEASYAHTAYLNSDYSREVHQRWADFTYTEDAVTAKMENAYNAPHTIEYAIFDPVYDGRNGLEFFRDRLGYRLVLRSANLSEWVAQNGTLVFKGKIQNVGFGNIINKKNVTAILKNKADGTTYSFLTDLDARQWLTDLDNRPTNTAAWRDLSFSVNLLNFGEVPAGEYDLFLKINDPKEQSENKRCVRFANNGEIWDAELGANLIGSTVVKEAELTEENQALLAAVEAIENADYALDEVLPADEESAIAAIEEIIEALGLEGVETEVEIVDKGDGSYDFRVAVSDENGDPIYTEVLTLTGHVPAEPVKENEVEPGCVTTGGYDLVTYCADCGIELAREHVEIPALGHEWDEGVVTTEPDCQNAGVMTFTCARCGETRTEALDKTEHTPEAVEAVPVTCTEPGYTAGTKCAVCGAILEGCEVIIPTGHTVVVDEAVPATCTEPGLTAGAHCSVCDEVLVAQQPVEALGHNWGEPEYVWAEDNSEVTATRVCKRDETHVETETVATTSEVTKEATYEEEGEIVYTAVFENEAFEEQTKTEVLPKLEKPVLENPFVDVKEGDYFYDPVLWAVNATPQITAGTDPTHFSPAATCTRAQVVTFIWRAMGEPEPTKTDNPFTDVKDDSYFYKAVLWAVEKGVTSGTSATTFGPNAGCTRAQVVTFLWRSAGEPEPTKTDNPFTDVSDGYYYKAVLWAVENEITSGTAADKFSPNATCTRGQIVTFLYRYLAD